MELTRVTEALTQAAGSMTRSQDVVGALNNLLTNCCLGLDADAGGVLLASGDQLELLAATSHKTSDLETYQLHADEGPCIEAYQTGTSTGAHTTETLTDRWPNFGHTMLAAGFQSVHATPLNIQGTTIGAIGLFRNAPTPFTPDEAKIAQAFADIASMLIVHYGHIPADQLTQQIHYAFNQRILIEQAKGVLADTHQLSMADAYELLVQNALAKQKSLTAEAEAVIRHVQISRP